MTTQSTKLSCNICGDIDSLKNHSINCRGTISHIKITHKLASSAEIMRVFGIPDDKASTPAVRQSTPAVRQSAPVVRQSAPAVRQSAPAVRQSAPAPVVRQSAPAPVVRQSAPAPVVRQSAPAVRQDATVVRQNTPAVRQSVDIEYKTPQKQRDPLQVPNAPRKLYGRGQSS
jgi:hypothetical protein